MRAIALTMAMLVGCGGGGDGSTTGTEEFVPTFEQNAQENVGACKDVPTYDLEDLDCAALAEAFEATTDAAEECEEASDCKVWRPQCEHWSAVGCFYSVNTCLDDSLLAEFNAASAGCLIATGQTGYCKCGGAPPPDCINGHCSFFYDFN